MSDPLHTGEFPHEGAIKWCVVHDSREPRYPWTQGRCWFALYGRRRHNDVPCRFVLAEVLEVDDE